LLLSPDPESGGRSDAFSFLFTLLLKEMEQAKERIGELQLEQKDLKHKVLRKQKQLDLLQSAMTNNKIANQISPRYSESTSKPVCIFV
jgi:C4-dicarboxylate-specific signal transduction histidine kinase